jgi:hypothetical protein
MLRKRIFFTAVHLFIGSYLLLYPGTVTAQHHSEHGVGGGIPGGNNRPTGLDEKDTLKDFHRALAVQATSQQITEFQGLLKDAEAAKASLQVFVQQGPNGGAASDSALGLGEIDHSLQRLRVDNQKFVDGFSAVQKSGLKDLLKKLGKADSELEADEKRLDEGFQAEGKVSTELGSRTASLTRSLTDFSNQELALAREMGLTLAEGSDQTFKLAEVRSAVTIGRQTIAVPVSAELVQVTSQRGQRTFNLERIVDLSALQQNLTELLRSQLEAAGSCGERLTVREATIASSTPASILALQLHYKRWSCLRLAGQTTYQELAEGNGSVEIKLTPMVEKANSLKLVTEFSRINAAGAMGESLRSGDLGQELRDKLNQSILSLLKTGVNFQNSLPLAVRNIAVVQSAKFQDVGVGKMSIVLNGQLELSDEQVSHLASELNQAQFAQGTSLQESPAAGSKSIPDR